MSWGIPVGKNRLLVAAAASCILLGISGAKAADIEPVVEPASWYISLFGGASWLDDVKTDYTFDGYVGTYHADVGTDTGFIIGGAVGTHLTEDLRVEFEVAYSENDVDKITYTDGFNAESNFDGNGKFGNLTFMANIWYDLPLSEELTPYLGGGAGIAVVDGDVGYEGIDDYDPIFNNSEVAFAFQVGAGLRWQVWENVTLDVGYRLRGIDGPTFDAKETDPGFDTSDYDAQWMWNHSLIGGISIGL
jgi:opacity protein-like surface antigen